MKALKVLPNRVCGDCVACCITPEIPALDKPADTRCPNLRQKARERPGCSIYRDRPESCGAFSCLWLMGFGAFQDRPDRTGVYLTVQDVGIPGVYEANRALGDLETRAMLAGDRERRGLAFVAMETQVGAVAGGTATRLVNELATRAPVFIRHVGADAKHFRLRAPPRWIECVSSTVEPPP